MPNPPPPPRRVRAAQDSKSATVRAAAAAPSKRQKSRWQREQRQQTLLYVLVGGLVGLIVLVVAGGWAFDTFVRPNEVIARVAGDTVTAADLLEEVRPTARLVDTQARESGGNPRQVAQMVDQQKRELPDSLLNDLVDERIIQQEANRRGLQVPVEDIDARMRASVAQAEAFANPAPTPTVPPEGAPTPTVFTFDPNTTPTALPTLEPSAYETALASFLGRSGLSESEMRERLRRVLLREQVKTAVEADLPTSQEQVHTRQILMQTEDGARAVLEQLNGGVDFATFAQQQSIDPQTKDNGGDMGWNPRGIQRPEWDTAAFALEPNQLSDVVRTTSGFHVIQLLEREQNRPVPADKLSTLRQEVFDNWMDERRTSDIQLSFSPTMRDWVLSRIGIRP